MRGHLICLCGSCNRILDDDYTIVGGILLCDSCFASYKYDLENLEVFNGDYSKADQEDSIRKA
jgi:hypothetical protein